ncbi:LEAF RUST 10 DISEASE-RESISTANCE LOCUS RECEPTOR-LIKE PROTEIN KINASE-like 1.2 [Camellia lanceoleosa]|uniref:LEAF RUST 10 DISEASE-RESISTANCE LOCUS RECEPTOR-LIKE PROTEIN KINASE-like 1.2 n=1 Tax=Camellia lanceoleosa TaxID=1840588 RepID=A0ACC0IAY5_9ERIC|nr:LEAF RUST 10 DISEASE-RESISTANCE LOCUS RECEPTOR-LIKE PROTEIN KINASE-like 1.2 [Camellia lanceoleosa]
MHDQVKPILNSSSNYSPPNPHPSLSISLYTLLSSSFCASTSLQMKQKSLSIHISSFNLGVFTFFLLSETTSCVDSQYEACVPKTCGGKSISYPFWIQGEQESYCGYPGFELTCQNNHSILQIPENNYTVQEIFYGNQSIRISVSNLGGECLPPIRNLSLEVGKFKFASSDIPYLHILSNCSLSLPGGLLDYNRISCGAKNEDVWGSALAMFENNKNLSYALGKCKTQVLAPVELNVYDGIEEDYMDVLRRGFVLRWTATDCSECESSGGRCGFNESSFHFLCFCKDRPHRVSCKTRGSQLKVVLATVIPGVILLLGLLILAIRYRKKLNYVSSVILSINMSSDPSSKPDLEGGSVYFGVPVFSYTELEEATNNFDPSKELGDGGFGTVYYGKLKDGREVAVKRLYEHNYKRVTQFMNEIEILTRLRHHNLVTLYGCTSRLSRELLLVYEYIPNGTVADHIHGDRAKDRPLVWSIRMSIAIETASALTYLHASDIIHRDVKTNNILLDNNFCVKVADFGLSRLFPNDVTHVSTAPQGTPGYVDPEYHQCYQLTDKSDVYSFGVVLIELISSMTAVDIGRHRHEINLANLAINRIQHRAFNELIDPSLGFESDSSIERMTTMVAEVAFQCLQLEKEMRPTMEEVLRALKEIQDSKDENTGDVIENAELLTSTRPPPSPEGDNIVLLKDGNKLRSPDAVTDRWVSSSSTSISSG